MRPEIIYKKKNTVRNKNTWRINNIFLNNRLLKKSKEKKIQETNDNENMTTQNLRGHSKSSSKREVYSNIILPQEIRKY